MSDALKAIHIIIELEGGYVNDPNDPGGETKYGISKRAFPNVDIKNLTVPQAYNIYKEHYWDKVSGDVLPWPINILLFDMAVHSGPTRAIKTAQEAFKLTADGVIGPRTIERLKRASTHDCAVFLRKRLEFLASLSNAKHYGAGWTNRLFKLALMC